MSKKIPNHKPKMLVIGRFLEQLDQLEIFEIKILKVKYFNQTH